MKRQEYEALMELFTAKINVMVEDAFGRDSINEVVRFNALEDEFRSTFIDESPS